MNWELKKSENIHSNPFFSVREDKVIKPNGEDGIYYVVEKKESVFIVPINSLGEIYLIKQFRYPTKTWSWEVPAGAIETGEEPIEAAERELQEETGLKAASWEKIGILPIGPGLSDNIGHLFVANGLSLIGNDKKEEEGIVDCKSFSTDQIKEMILNKELIDVPSLAMLTIAGLF